MSTKQKKNQPGNNLKTLNPHLNPEEQLGMGPHMRRAVDIKYTCPLCARTHIGTIYVTGPDTSPQQFQQYAETILRDSQAAPKALSQVTRLIHEERGDYDRLKQEVQLTGATRRMAILEINVTGESEYTCEACSTTFPNIAALRQHQGRNPRTGSVISQR